MRVSMNLSNSDKLIIRVRIKSKNCQEYYITNRFPELIQQRERERERERERLEEFSGKG